MRINLQNSSTCSSYPQRSCQRLLRSSGRLGGFRDLPEAEVETPIRGRGSRGAQLQRNRQKRSGSRCQHLPPARHGDLGREPLPQRRLRQQQVDRVPPRERPKRLGHLPL